jgi:replicative DNA helicase
MSHDQVIRRLTATESGIGITSLKTGKLLESEWPAFMRTVDTFDSLPILVDDQPAITPSYLRAEAMKAEATAGPLALIVVDYLQLMRPDGRHSSRREDVTAIGQALKGLAKDLNVPVLALSQLNRVSESRNDKRPQLHDLRESGDLEQTANTVVLMYRDELNDPDAMPGVTEVIVAKHRDGPEGVAHLIFQKQLARFVDADITREVL